MIEIACKGILFDLDGVLIDSTPAVTRVWTKWATVHGFDPAAVVYRAHGRPSIATIREYLPNADHEAENSVVERGELDDTDGVVPLPGAQELLSVLPPDRWAIVTSCTRQLAHTRLRAAGLTAPRYLVTADDIRNGKPDPEPYLQGASLFRLRPVDCIVVEDVPAGVRSGKVSGARVIAVTTTVGKAELQAAGADWIVESCERISLSPTDNKEGIRLILPSD